MSAYSATGNNEFVAVYHIGINAVAKSFAGCFVKAELFTVRINNYRTIVAADNYNRRFGTIRIEDCFIIVAVAFSEFVHQSDTFVFPDIVAGYTDEIVTPRIRFSALCGAVKKQGSGAFS